MRRGVVLFLICALWLSACAKDKPSQGESMESQTEPTTTAEPSEPAPSVQTKEDNTMPSTEEGVLSLEGTLKYTELPRTKSVAAYMGKEFTLTLADGTEHNLSASESVSHEQLQAQDGKTIKITCRPYGPSDPNPMESAPTGMDGKPLQRPGGCEVLSLTAS